MKACCCPFVFQIATFSLSLSFSPPLLHRALFNFAAWREVGTKPVRKPAILFSFSVLPLMPLINKGQNCPGFGMTHLKSVGVSSATVKQEQREIANPTLAVQHQKTAQE